MVWRLRDPPEGFEPGKTKIILEWAEQHGLKDAKSTSVPMQPGLKLQKAAVTNRSHPYRSLIGSFLWISKATRPVISYAVAHLTQFVTCFDQTHIQAAKDVLRYLKTTAADYQLLSVTSSGPKVLKAFTDADYAGFWDTSRSVSGIVFFYGNSLISRSSTKQTMVKPRG